MKRSWFRVLLRRRLFVIFLLLLQVAFIIFVFKESYISGILQAVVSAISFLIAFYVISKKDKGANKVAWVFLLLLFPVFGCLFYLLYYFQASTRKFSSKSIRIDEENRKYYILPGDAFDEAERLIPQHLPQIRYLQKFAGYPVYGSTRTEYFSPGEKFLPVLLQELEKAKKYIFMEYFIIQEGVMWNAVLDVLKKKASQGIDVRILYDDIGCFLTLPKNFASQMKTAGIKCEIWAGLTPANNESANKKKSTRCSKAGQYLKPLLIQCALAAVKSKKEPYFAIKYQRLAKRRGKKKAIIAIARMMLTCIYHMLSEERDFHPDDYEAVIYPPVQKSVVLNLDNTLQFLREQGADPETLKLIQQQCAAQPA